MGGGLVASMVTDRRQVKGVGVPINGEQVGVDENASALQERFRLYLFVQYL